MKENQCLYNVFDCAVLKAYLKYYDIEISSFKTMFDFYCDFLKPRILDLYLDDFLKHCPDRSISDICNHIENVCHEFYDQLEKKGLKN